MTLIICDSLSINVLWLPIIISFTLCSQLLFAENNVTLNLPFSDPETVVSSNGLFKLGFFSPNYSTNRYLGIWYNKLPELKVIWVANRGEPIKDSFGSVTISKDGNLVLLNGQKQIHWSSNFTASTTSTTALLLNTGNLILQDVSTRRTLWECFQNPTDSFLQHMRLSYDLNTGDKAKLTSWTSPSDPSTGEFSLGLGSQRPFEIVLWKGSQPHWRSGPWDGQTFVGIPSNSHFHEFSFNIVDDRHQTAYFTFSYTVDDVLLYFQLTSQGVVQRLVWHEGLQNSEISWYAPEDECANYGRCGPFGICDINTSPLCSCLAGFVPMHDVEWKNGNFTSGCVRQTPLQLLAIRSFY